MKVLIISHCQLSVNYSIGKTLASLFSAFNKNELCQLYVHAGLPDIDICESYYRLTDKDVIKGVFRFGAKGNEVSAMGNDTDNAFRKSTKPLRAIKLKELLRDAIWKASPWFGKDLRTWLDKEKPTCIFVAVGSGKFLYDIALKISKVYNIPVITYVCDDYYFDRTDRSLTGKIWSRKLRKKSDRLFTSSKAIVSICPKMSEIYRNTFYTQTYTVMTGASINKRKEFNKNEKVKNLNYFGKLSLRRYESIFDIGKTLDEINLSDCENFVLNIYCGGITEEMKMFFNGVKAIRFHDFVRGEDFVREFLTSDLLLHVESFDERMKERVKYSVSTKIADSLASGIPLFAYGPCGIASMDYLAENSAAITVMDKNQLKNGLRDALYNNELRNKTIENAEMLADKNHNTDIVSQTVKTIILKTVNAVRDVF